MKLIHQQTAKRLLGCILLLWGVLNSGSVFAIGITGPTSTQPGVQQQYDHADELYPAWFTDYALEGATSADVSISANPFSAPRTSIFLTVHESATMCKFKLVYYVHTSISDGHGGIMPGPVERYELEITVLPHVVIPKLYPGVNTPLSIQDNCGHTGCNYLWNVSPPAVCPTCGPTGTSTQNIYINPTVTLPETVTASCIMSTCSPSVGSLALESKYLEVALQNPVIAGPVSIGCNPGIPPASYTFTASVPFCSNIYNWSVPSFLTIVAGGGTSDHYVTVVENSLGTGNIQLQTHYASGSLIASDVVNYPIQVCCLSHLAITTDVNAPSVDRHQTALDITASNTVNSGASAMYHAGGTVKLTTGFHAAAGSYFHGYIQQCDGSYNVAVHNNDEPETDEAEPENYAVELPVSEGTRAPAATLHVFPNPTNGIFRVKTSLSAGLPDQIVVHDAMGTPLQTIDHPQAYETTIDLGEHSAGVYFISVSYANTVLNGKIVKNQ